MYTKEEAFKRINELQDRYEIELINLIKNENNVLKEINFSSPTGTGKTNMIAGVINKLSDNEYFFIITTLSKGQLDKQIRRKIEVLSYAFLAPALLSSTAILILTWLEDEKAVSLIEKKAESPIRTIIIQNKPTLKTGPSELDANTIDCVSNVILS